MTAAISLKLRSSSAANTPPTLHAGFSSFVRLELSYGVAFYSSCYRLQADFNLGHTWDIPETYLGHIWDISEINRTNPKFSWNIYISSERQNN
jgi:hypothetical protein